MDKTRISICLFLAVWSNVEGQSGVPGQSGYNMYSRLNPITYYGFTQPYLSGFYGGIGGMPYMSSWQASMYQGDNSQNPMALMGLAMGGPGLGGLGGGLGSLGGGFGSWNAAHSKHTSGLFTFSSLLCLFLTVVSLQRLL